MSVRSHKLLNPYWSIPEYEFGQMIPKGEWAEGRAWNPRDLRPGVLRAGFPTQKKCSFSKVEGCTCDWWNRHSIKSVTINLFNMEKVLKIPVKNKMEDNCVKEDNDPKMGKF